MAEAVAGQVVVAVGQEAAGMEVSKESVGPEEAAGIVVAAKTPQVAVVAAIELLVVASDRSLTLHQISDLCLCEL